MAGHGSLCPKIARSSSPVLATGWKYATALLPCSALLLCSALLSCSTLLLPVRDSAAADPTINLQASQDDAVDVGFDFSWNAKEPQFCHLRIRLVDESSASRCVIRDLENLSESDQTVAAFSLNQDATQLTFHPRGQVDSAVIRFRVQGTRNSRIVIEILDDPRTRTGSPIAQPVREIALTDLLQVESFHSETTFSTTHTAEQQPSWSIRRVKNDEIRLSGLPAVPVYTPGEELNLAAVVNAMMRQASTALTLQYSIVQVSNDETIVLHRHPIRINSNGNSDPIRITEVAPDTPGVYELRCQVSEVEDRIWDRLRRREPPLLRIGRPFFVVPEQGITIPPTANPWKTAGTLRPSESNWSVGQWLPKTTTRFIPGVNSQSLESELERAQHDEETVSLLQPQKTFQATLPILTAGLPHKITIRLPATQNVQLRFEVGGLTDRDHPATRFTLADTKTTNLGEQWRTHTFVHYPVDDDQIWLTNLSNEVVQLESIQVESGPQHLVQTRPDLNSSRETASSSQRNTILQLGGIDWVDSLSTDVSKRYRLDECDATTIAMVKLWVALDRACDLAHTNGMNGIMLPANAGGRTVFQTRSLLPKSDSQKSEINRLATTMKLLVGRGLETHVSLDPDFMLSPIEQALRERPALINSLTRTHLDKPNQYNLLQPLVQASLQELLAELRFQCSQWDHFAGITVDCGSESHLQPLTRIFDDTATLTAFAQSLNVVVDLEQLRAWTRGDGKLNYENWVREETDRCYRALQNVDEQSLLVLKLEQPTNSGANTEPRANTIPEFKANGDSQLIAGRSLGYTNSPLLLRKPLLLSHLNSAENDAAEGAVFFNTELQTDSEPVVHGGPLFLEDTCRLIDHLNPSHLVISMPLDGRILRPNLDQLLRTFQSMPEASTQPVGSHSKAQNAVRLRSVQHDGFLHLYCMCLTPWANEIDIETTAPIQWQAVGVDPEAIELKQVTTTRTRVRIPERQLILLRSTQPVGDAKIVSWKTRLSGGPAALAEIKRKVTVIAERIGILFDFQSYDALNNGGFENADGLGLVGWLHAQHPDGCVRVDDTQPLEGKHSIRLTTDTGMTARTWIISETISPPKSGRLAVSLACRAEANQDSGVHRLKVSLEAIENGKPIRFSNEFDVPKNGQWGSREVILEALNIDAANMHSLRLTIDSLSSGRIWIDDIRLHDQFPTARERDELQNVAFLAVQGLQKSNLNPAGRLLHNGWALHLLKLDPLQDPEAATEAAPATEKTPGIAERIKDWIPRSLRF